MAKLITVTALISVLLVIIIANASAYRTITTTIVINDPNPREESETESQKCRQQAESQDLSHCEKYLSQSESLLRMHGSGKNKEDHLGQCCHQIKQVDDECQCKAIEYTMEKLQGQGQKEEAQEMMQRAMKIPTYCRLSQRCQFTAVRF